MSRNKINRLHKPSNFEACAAEAMHNQKLDPKTKDIAKEIFGIFNQSYERGYEQAWNDIINFFSDEKMSELLRTENQHTDGKRFAEILCLVKKNCDKDLPASKLTPERYFTNQMRISYLVGFSMGLYAMKDILEQNKPESGEVQ